MPPRPGSNISWLKLCVAPWEQPWEIPWRIPSATTVRYTLRCLRCTWDTLRYHCGNNDTLRDTHLEIHSEQWDTFHVHDITWYHWESNGTLRDTLRHTGNTEIPSMYMRYLGVYKDVHFAQHIYFAKFDRARSTRPSSSGCRTSERAACTSSCSGRAQPIMAGSWRSSSRSPTSRMPWTPSASTARWWMGSPSGGR